MVVNAGEVPRSGTQRGKEDRPAFCRQPAEPAGAARVAGHRSSLEAAHETSRLEDIMDRLGQTRAVATRK
jgi:hypothetical protein